MQVEILIYPEDTLSGVLFRVVAATSEWAAGLETRHVQGNREPQEKILCRSLNGLDPLWYQSAAALAVGPGEFAQFQVETQWGVLHHKRLLKEYLAHRDAEIVLVPSGYTNSANKRIDESVSQLEWRLKEEYGFSVKNKDF